jgi:hypothetical protein
VADIPPTTQLYELKFTAVGEVRDADGNLISSTPVEATRIVTEAEAKAYVEGNH